MSSELDRYLQDDSPFLPEVDLRLLNAIIRDLFLEQGYRTGEAIARGLVTGIALLTSSLTSSVVEALSGKPDKRIETMGDLAEYARGFTLPLRLLQIAYVEVEEKTGELKAKSVGEPKIAKTMISWLPVDAERDFLLENISLAVSLLRADSSGVKLINQIVRKELSRAANLYYKIGLEAARRTFVSYAEILDTLIPPPGDEEKGPESLLPRLIEYEQIAPTSPKPLSGRVRHLEETLAKLIENPSCSTALLISLRYPILIPRFFIFVSRFIYNACKNPDFAMREMSRAADETGSMIPKMQEAVRGEWQPGELVSRLEPEFATFQERISRVIPSDPYANKDFVRDIRRIRDLSKRAASEADVARELLEEWEQLAKQPGLEEHPALWTAIHITFGDFAKQQFALTGERRFIRAARRAYSTPLKKSSLWRADLGTRCMCAARLGELYCKHGSDLEMPALEIAQAIHDAYLDLIMTNERLYQRSPFRESKERLQARINLAVARVIESCVYLSGSSETESVDWRREAFMIAENGKSRMLREEMALAERIPPMKIPSTLCDDEKKLLERLREIYADLAARKQDLSLGPPSFDEFNEERNELRLGLEQVWAKMEDYGDEARAYISVRRDEAIQWGQFQWDTFQKVAERLGERVALVSMSRLPDSVFLSVLRAGWEAPEVCVVSLSRENLSRYLHTYNTEILARDSIDPTGLWWKLHPPTNEWQGLGEVLFVPLEPFLTDVECVYFFPHGPLHRLPLHALTVDGRPFIEQWAVAYAPSTSVLESTLSRPRNEGSVLVMGYAPPDDPREGLTELILREASEVASHFHAPLIPAKNANSETLIEQGQSARLIHLSCHGEFEPEDPLESGIELIDGRFSARDWLRLRLRADLVTLSACQTGISDIRLGDDLGGLMRAILFAGASSLLMTLWSVNAKTTRDWMLEFYRNIWDEDGRQLADKAAAFRKATLKLREEHAAPYFWAPFVLVGNFQ